jgi:uncharacterized membrane protein
MPSITAINVAHLHLLLNHVPTVGTVVALGLLLLAIIRQNEHLKHAGLEVLFAIAVVTLVAYMSGVAAHQKLRDQPGVSDNAIRVHHDAALAGFTVLEFAGFAAWIALWQTRRRGGAVPGLVPVVTVLTVVSLALLARAANLGGEIRHPEIRADLTDGVADPADHLRQGSGESRQSGEEADVPERFVTTAISTYMVNSTWAWPAAETVHFLGLSLSFGVLLAVNLRILGVMKRVPFADVHRLLPWGMLGFGANLITGMLFFIGQPRQYIDSAPFYWKVVFLMIAGANFLYLTVFKKAWTVDADGWDASLADKAMAVSSLFAWLAVLYGGRMLPFIGHAF